MRGDWDQEMGGLGLRILALLALLLAVTGCASRVQEPWVSNDLELKEERARTPQLATELRQRLAEQSDR